MYKKKGPILAFLVIIFFATARSITLSPSINIQIPSKTFTFNTPHSLLIQQTHTTSHTIQISLSPSCRPKVSCPTMSCDIFVQDATSLEVVMNLRGNSTNDAKPQEDSNLTHEVIVETDCPIGIKLNPRSQLEDIDEKKMSPKSNLRILPAADGNTKVNAILIAVGISFFLILLVFYLRFKKILCRCIKRKWRRWRRRKAHERNTTITPVNIIRIRIPEQTFTEEDDEEYDTDENCCVKCLEALGNEAEDEIDVDIDTERSDEEDRRKSELVRKLEKLKIKKVKINRPKNGLGMVNTTVGDDILCVICMTEPKNIVYRPCNHVCACLECSKKHFENSNACPMCRTVVSGVDSIQL